MFNLYSVNKVARIEHEMMVRSLPRVAEYGYHERERKSEKSHRPVLRVRIRQLLTAILHLVTK
jgi:hypothetical protein